MSAQKTYDDDRTEMELAFVAAVDGAVAGVVCRMAVWLEKHEGQLPVGMGLAAWEVLACKAAGEALGDESQPPNLVVVTWPTDEFRELDGVRLRRWRARDQCGRYLSLWVRYTSTYDPDAQALLAAVLQEVAAPSGAGDLEAEDGTPVNLEGRQQ